MKARKNLIFCQISTPFHILWSVHDIQNFASQKHVYSIPLREKTRPMSPRLTGIAQTFPNWR